jgi:hypothetical protein
MALPLHGNPKLPRLPRNRYVRLSQKNPPLGLDFYLLTEYALAGAMQRPRQPVFA